jgi:fructokinase
VRVISIGEVLWDVIGDSEHLGGAPFNFAAHAKILGHTLFFASAVEKDELGQRVIRSMEELALSTRYVRLVRGCPGSA